MPITDHTLNEASPVLHYLSYSDKPLATSHPALIFLHGVTSHAHYWDDIGPGFSREYASFALDWRGHGDSGQAPRYNHIEDYLEDLQRLVATLNPLRFSLVGHSLGGFVALAYAALAEPRLEKLVICDVKTGLTAEESEGFKRAMAKPASRFATLEELENRFRSTLRDSSASSALLNRLARQGGMLNEDGTYSFKYDRRVLDFPAPDLWRYTPKVDLPVLVINGANSQMMPSAEATRLTAALPQARHVEIAEAGHHVFLDQPNEFSQSVRQFLS